MSGGPPAALVTGASRGIGKAIAAELSRAGRRVLLVARNEAALRAAAAEIPGATCQPADLREPAAAARIAAWATELGPIDILVHGAGTAPSDRFENTSDAVVDEALDLHVRAPFRLARALLPGMKQRHSGQLVFLASTAGLRGYPFTAAYCAAKHGMVGLVRALHAELEASGVRAFAICPGFVDTDITRNAAAAIAARGRTDAAQALLRLGKMNRIGRLHTTAEVAAAVAGLLRSPPAGCVLDLDHDPPIVS
jgi:NAD(P)-dependent dehydrogenase (short-subunit alcohol dehydrogenase family)